MLIDISVVKVERIQEENKSLDMSENKLLGWEIFTLSPVVYMTVDLKQVVNNLIFHPGSTLVESQMNLTS